ncbi:MAG: cysteine desulfurase DndA [Deltaproteobacteria bacterium HGW-Deltaproteobacteria-2]|jgi:cysteine desulfurase|nr:MAG: cysteine desulfurase DndA [Deltaproteobacteria bacterium HGW-Deltaproteobacteria-2]
MIATPVYLDCNATSPLDPEVREMFFRFLTEEHGNEGSSTHVFGTQSKQAVRKAREQIAAVVSAKHDDVIFTSGATESNNLAILGLRSFGQEQGKRHIITTQIEHKAVLEPCRALENDGFEITYLPVARSGAVDLDAICAALRSDTLLISVMHVNNETGIRQPLDEIAEVLNGHDAFFHTDAAQGFGKDLEPLHNPRIDLISISGHKIYAPMGIGALITRRRKYNRPPTNPLLYPQITPLVYGGGQERGLRSGTLPVALIVALGAAAEIAVRDHEKRLQACKEFRRKALEALAPLDVTLTGQQSLVMDHVLNISFPGLDADVLLVALKDLIAISDGSACTSSRHGHAPRSTSHVLKAMGMNDDEANACIRLSCCHLTPEVDWSAVVNRIRALQ